MKITEINIENLQEATWNSNKMDEAMLQHLRTSINKYSLLANLVVRPLTDGRYEVLSGNQRLKVLKEIHHSPVPCVIVEVDDAHARLLAEALNHIKGDDDLGLRAEALRQVLAEISEQDILDVLPDTKVSLAGLVSLGQGDMAGYLQNWEKAREARLKHYQFQLAKNQTATVEEALAQVMPVAKQEKGDSPNIRGTALYLLCKFYLENKKDE